MAKFLFADYGATTVAAAVTTVPATGTVETWTVASTSGSPPLPQITGGQTQYTATVWNPVSDYINPEVVLVTAILNSTQLTVQRGFNGIVKTHSVGDNFVNTISAEFLNQLSSDVGEVALGTVATTEAMPAQAGVYTTATATLTASDACAFTLPQAIGGYEFTFYITNPASGVTVPTFTAYAGDSSPNWLSPLDWVMTPGATNIIDFQCAATGQWQVMPGTSGLGVAAPLQEQIDYQSALGASYSFPSPLATPYYTLLHGVLSANHTLTVPTPIAGASFTAWIDQPAGGSYTLDIVAATGTIRWATSTGTPPAAPAAGKRLWVGFVGDNTPTWQASVISTAY